jgi:hypothetical protein
MAIVLDGTTGITTPALDTETRIAPTDLGTGTPDATNFLRGDGSWQVISTTPTTDQVLTATAGASAGAVGTYAYLRAKAGVTNITFGNTAPGSSLTGSNSQQSGTANVSGTWRILGSFMGENHSTLAIRIS